MMSQKPLPDTTLEQWNEFRVVAENVSKIFANHGLVTRPYKSPELEYFSNLNEKDRARSLYRLSVYEKSLMAAINAGSPISNNSQALWYALKTLNVIPDSDIFSKFKNDDVIEYYDKWGTQIWRNFNYMKICSYTFEELCTHDWPTLYIRDENLNQALITLMVDTVSRGERGPKFIDVDYHECEERFSDDRYKLHVRHDYICPLFDQSNQSAGFIVTSKVKIIGAGTSLTNSRSAPAFNLIEA